MKIKVSQTKIVGKALLITQDDELICYKHGQISIFDNRYHKKYTDIKLPMKWWKRILIRFRLIERLLHITAKWAAQIGDKLILLQFNKNIYVVNYLTREIKVQDVPIRGKPLMICRVEGVPGFDDSYLVGDYGDNAKREPVNIYSFSKEKAEWKLEYTFAAGMVRHIHGFFVDRKNSCIYIFTGDRDSESGIWKATDGFSTVVPAAVGSQKYRTCQMRVSNRGKIYYLTDSPSEKNYVYELDDGRMTAVSEVQGSCINGSRLPFGGVYATVCEPNDRASKQHGLAKYYLTSAPSEYVSKTVHVLYMDDDGDLETIATFEHDGMPLFLFQFATVTFSNYSNQKLFFTPQSVKKYDNRVFCVLFTQEDDQMTTKTK